LIERVKTPGFFLRKILHFDKKIIKGYNLKILSVKFIKIANLITELAWDYITDYITDITLQGFGFHDF